MYVPPLKRLKGGMTKISGEEGVVLLAGGIHSQLREIIHVCLLSPTQVHISNFGKLYRNVTWEYLEEKIALKKSGL
jgi:hypothetical protein